jgi:hypothetical protein
MKNIFTRATVACHSDDSMETSHVIGTREIAGIANALFSLFPSLYAQPSGQFRYPQHSYTEIPHEVLLDTPSMTVEAWVAFRDAHSPACSSIAGTATSRIDVAQSAGSRRQTLML